MSEELMRRKEIMEQFHISRRVIENYEKLGLVVPTARNKYGNKLYSRQQVERIGKIRLYQRMGFELKNINSFIDKPEIEIKELIIIKKKEIELEIKEKEELITIIDELLAM